MRILLVNRNSRPHTGGANRVVVETIALLKAAGHDLALAYWENETPATDCECLRVEGNDFTPGAGLLSAAESFRPDVVQFHMVDAPDLESRVAERWPTCHFLHDQSWFCSGGDRMARDLTPCHRAHGAGCLLQHVLQGCGGRNPLGNFSRWRKVQARQPLNQRSKLRFQAASDFMRRGLLENRVPAGRIDLVPLFTLPAKNAEPTAPNRLLVASRLVRNKGLEVLFEALAEIKDKPWKLRIAGDGPLRGEFEAYGQRLGLQERIEFLGELSTEALDGEYAGAMVVIHPTVRQEPFGLVGPEAIAHGKPVIAFTGGATEEWLKDDETGLLVPERTPHALAKAVSKLLGNRELCEEFGRKALSQWQRFAPEKYVENLTASFERTIQSFRA